MRKQVLLVLAILAYTFTATAQATGAPPTTIQPCEICGDPMEDESPYDYIGTQTMKEKFVIETLSGKIVEFGSDGKYFYILSGGKWQIQKTGIELTGAKPLTVAKPFTERFSNCRDEYLIFVFKDTNNAIRQARYDTERQAVVSISLW